MIGRRLWLIDRGLNLRNRLLNRRWLNNRRFKFCLWNHRNRRYTSPFLIRKIHLFKSTHKIVNVWHHRLGRYFLFLRGLFDLGLRQLSLPIIIGVIWVSSTWLLSGLDSLINLTCFEHTIFPSLLPGIIIAVIKNRK